MTTLEHGELLLEVETDKAVVDGTHTSTDGAKLYAAVIARALRDPTLGGVTR